MRTLLDVDERGLCLDSTGLCSLLAHPRHAHEPFPFSSVAMALSWPKLQKTTALIDPSHAPALLRMNICRRALTLLPLRSKDLPTVGAPNTARRIFPWLSFGFVRFFARPSRVPLDRNFIQISAESGGRERMPSWASSRGPVPMAGLADPPQQLPLSCNSPGAAFALGASYLHPVYFEQFSRAANNLGGDRVFGDPPQHLSDHFPFRLIAHINRQVLMIGRDKDV